MSIEDRLAALEERIWRIEAGAAVPQAGDGDPGSDAQGVFWALAGLRARVGEPGAVLVTGHVLLPDGRLSAWQEAAGTEELLGGHWAEVADVLGALGHPIRLTLLQQVLRGVSTVHELTALDGVGTSGQVYHHLRQLVSSGWLRARGAGHYEVPVARVVPLLAVIVGARR